MDRQVQSLSRSSRTASSSDHLLVDVAPHAVVLALPRPRLDRLHGINFDDVRGLRRLVPGHAVAHARLGRFGWDSQDIGGSPYIGHPGSPNDRARLPPPRRRDGGAMRDACRPQPGPSLVQRRYALRVSAAPVLPRTIFASVFHAHEGSCTWCPPAQTSARPLAPPNFTTWALQALPSICGSPAARGRCPWTAPQRQRGPWGAPPKFCAARNSAPTLDPVLSRGLWQCQTRGSSPVVERRRAPVPER